MVSDVANIAEKFGALNQFTQTNIPALQQESTKQHREIEAIKKTVNELADQLKEHLEAEDTKEGNKNV